MIRQAAVTRFLNRQGRIWRVPRGGDGLVILKVLDKDECSVTYSLVFYRIVQAEVYLSRSSFIYTTDTNYPVLKNIKNIYIERERFFLKNRSLLSMDHRQIFIFIGFVYGNRLKHLKCWMQHHINLIKMLLMWFI